MTHKPVTIYTTQTCQYCKATKAFLQEQGVPYQEIDVGSDPDKAREMIQKSGQMGVPVIVIGEGPEEQLIVGFDQARIAAALGIGS
jgi:Glutaredoxin and related proteins